MAELPGTVAGCGDAGELARAHDVSRTHADQTHRHPRLHRATCSSLQNPGGEKKNNLSNRNRENNDKDSINNMNNGDSDDDDDDDDDHHLLPRVEVFGRGPPLGGGESHPPWVPVPKATLGSWVSKKIAAGKTRKFQDKA